MRTLFNWKAAIWSGLIAGAIFLMVEMAMVAFLQGQSPWGPPRMMAAIVQGEGVLPPPATFDLGIVAVAMMVHFSLSVVLGLVFGLAYSRANMSAPVAAASGTMFGLAVYVVDFHLLTALFPWFAMARGTVSIIGHAVFGLVLGSAYHRFAGASGQVEHATTS
jgi:uncharacterized membrane protein (DUF485 family)